MAECDSGSLCGDKERAHAIDDFIPIIGCVVFFGKVEGEQADVLGFKGSSYVEGVFEFVQVGRKVISYLDLSDGRADRPGDQPRVIHDLLHKLTQRQHFLGDQQAVDERGKFAHALFGAAAQFGIFFTLFMASLFGFDLKDAASIAIIGAADGPTSIFVATELGSGYLGAIMVAAYSYMALVPLVQPPIIKLCTTKAERKIKMQYKGKPVSKLTKILFPIVVTMIVAFVAPDAVALIGFLMFGNLIRECGVLNSLSETAQNVLANLITIFLGISIASQMRAEDFLQWDTLIIIGLGLVAFIFDTFGGIMVAKIMNLFSKEKINPMIGAAGISAFPMSARVVHKLGLEEDNQNFLLMHSIGVNVSGQIASVIAGGLILALVKSMLGG